MPHDDFPTCKRLFGDVGGGHMMAPLFVHLNQTFPWSPCSALYITEFFDNGHGRSCISSFSSLTIWFSLVLFGSELFCLVLLAGVWAVVGGI